MLCPTLTELPPPSPQRIGWPWTENSRQLHDRAERSKVCNDVAKWPKITIVTPSFNQGKFLEETIRSVLLQGYPNLEYIVVDGGSTDGSIEIIRRYNKHLTWWVSEKDLGQSHAINKGFARASGEIHAYLNSDDLYEPGALFTCARAFRDGHQWVVGQVRYFQKNVGHWPVPQAKGKSLAEWLMPCPFSQPGCFWTAELHRELGVFREDLHYFFDYEFWLRIRFKKQIKPLVIDKLVAIYRVHSQSKTVAHKPTFMQEGRHIIEQYERLLTRAQRARLFFGRRHRKARQRGSTAVSLLRKGQFRAATKRLISAVVVWPFLIIDLHGILIAIKAMNSPKIEGPAVQEVWPEWDE